jgi:hypothetical protein
MTMKPKSIALFTAAGLSACLLLLLSLIIVRASSAGTREAPQVLQLSAFGDTVRDAPAKPAPAKSGLHAAWTVEFPENTRTGRFVAKGTLNVYPDLNRTEESVVVGVLVQDAATGETLDARDHGRLEVDPRKAYSQRYSENFDLPPGRYRVRFRASYAASAAGEHTFSDKQAPMFAEAAQLVVVD